MQINTLKKILVLLTLISAVIVCEAQSSNKPLWKNDLFALYNDSLVQQKKFTGKAVSRNEIRSNYQSPANQFQSADITFKFAINGKDNEMISGKDHHFTVHSQNDKAETPIIHFGTQLNQTSPDAEYLSPNTILKIRLDLRDVINQFNQKGFFTTFNGDKIYKEDFKGVYVAGGTAPLIWDFDNLVHHSDLKLQDDDGDGIYETNLVLNKHSDEKHIESQWKLIKDISAYPQYSSDHILIDALYKMSLEEMVKAIEPDSTFRTGKEWAGVWTRDISYSIILSMAYLQPDVAKKSLLKKVNKRNRIIQDTGTGGAWPASTDRMIWATAAWELYKSTGDEDWLKQAYQIIKNSTEDDYKVAYDKVTGMVKGESSFLDWREQTYPKWMQPVDIYESECLGTNAVHYNANIVLSNMATLLNDKISAAKYKQIAERIKAGINKYLWLPEKGYYGQYLYGRSAKIVSPRAEALGESLVVLFGIADGKQKQVISKTPVMDFGIPCIYPQIPNIPPYHNNAVWPFVQTYYALAAAKAGNEDAVMESIATIYRPAALWLTNKENFVASTGDFAGTQINSSNMLWSLSGNLALIHKIIFGINLNSESITFRPFVPEALAGKRSLTNFTYRNSVLDIEMEGYGNQIKSFTIDGKVSEPKILNSLQGYHSIKIVLANNKLSKAGINSVEHYVTINVPSLAYSNKTLSWNPIAGAGQYQLLKDGKKIGKTDKTKFTVANENYGEYQVIAVDAKGIQSFASEPLIVAADNLVTKYEIEKNAIKSSEPYKGFSGEGFVELSKTKNTKLTMPITIDADGLYAIDFKYANGNGPTNTENKCAIRSLNEGNKFLGTIVLPQRGKGEWSNWGWTNSIKLYLKKGLHTLTITLEDWNENMNGEINQAMLDYARIIKVR